MSRPYTFGNLFRYAYIAADDSSIGGVLRYCDIEILGHLKWTMGRNSPEKLEAFLDTTTGCFTFYKIDDDNENTDIGTYLLE